MRGKYKGKGFAAVLLLLAGLLAGTMTSYGVVYVSEDYYDWDGYADYDDDDDYDYDDEDSPRAVESGMGPGALSGVDDLNIAAGPSVTTVSLTERYHEEYRIYEESLNNLFFFYANVSNGGITDKSVTLDIPQNMTCTVEKDGAEYSYVPGMSFSEYGTYVVKLSVMEDTSAPFSEQKEYRALFRFRIQAKPPREEEEETGGPELQISWGSEGLGISGSWEESGVWQDGTAADTGEGEPGAGESEAESQEAESEAFQEPSGPSGEAAPGMEGESGEAGQEAPEESSSDGGEEAAAAGGQTVAAGYSARTQVYDNATGSYKVTFENGRVLSSNIPEGYIGPGMVDISVSEGEVCLYCNDEPLEYTGNMSLTEPGYYRLEVDGQTWSFAIASDVSSMDYYLAPTGMEFTAVYVDGQPAELPGGRYIPMKEDGQYQITMAGEGGETLEAVLKKDTRAPEFVVSVRGGTAQIQYVSDDIADVTLERNGELQQGFTGYTVNSPGSYRLTVSDAAGNASSAEFTLKYQVNKYGIMAVVVVILLIVGGVVFVVHVKKTVKIR